MISDYDALPAALRQAGWSDWADHLSDWLPAYFEQPGHGDYDRWRDALERLPPVQPLADLDRPTVRLGQPLPASATDRHALTGVLKTLMPWRKGPFELGGIVIDSEWRSDWKWQRLQGHLELRGQRVLDVGAGNGYFGWRMLGAGAKLVIGVDPTLLFVMQFLLCRRLAGELPHWLLPQRLEDLPGELGGFDTVFSMGVLYHRRIPADHLQRLRTLLRPGGQLLLETLIIDGEGEQLLQPPDRYARMRNVHALPTVTVLQRWLEAAGFDQIRLLDRTLTTAGEQRPTDWMTFESLAHALDPADPGLTIEGHPAPLRAMLLARQAG